MLLVPIPYLVVFSHNKMENLKKQICPASCSLCPTTVKDVIPLKNRNLDMKFLEGFFVKSAFDAGLHNSD